MWKNWKCDVTQSLPPPPPPVTNCHTFSDPLPPWSVTYFMDGPYGIGSLRDNQRTRSCLIQMNCVWKKSVDIGALVVWPSRDFRRDMTCHDVAWRDVTLRDVAWRDITWQDVTWRDMTWHDVVWHDIRWNYVTWRNMTWRDPNMVAL